eukprot:scaffold14018_cov200-Alexandrium_tamarense.AAC.4
MEDIAKSEGMVLGGDATNDGLSVIAEHFDCDLRRIVNEMQLFHFSPGTTQTSNFVALSLPAPQVTYPTTDDRPLITSIEPAIVPRESYTVVTILGKNFTSAILYIGGMACIYYSVVNDSKIVAVCPPLDVSREATNGRYEARFAEVVVRKRCSNGLILGSDSCLPIEEVELTSRVTWNIQYDIPVEQSLLEQKLSKVEFIRRARAQRRRDEANGNYDDGFLSSSDEEFEKVDPSPEIAKTSDDTVDDETPNKDAAKVSVDPKTLLDEAVAKASSGIFEQNDKTTCSSTLTSESSQYSSLQIDVLADEMSRLSDAALFEYSLTSLGIRDLSGSVEGFGYDPLSESSLTDDLSIEKLSKGGIKKPPSFESLYVAGANENSFFFGNADCYMTRPIRRRERYLLSSSEAYSRGIGSLDISRVQEAADEEAIDSNFHEDVNSFHPSIRRRVQSEDDILLSPRYPSSLMILPKLLTKRLEHCEVLRTSDMILLQQRSNSMSVQAIDIMLTILAPDNCDWTNMCYGLRQSDWVNGELAQKSRAWIHKSLLDDQLASDYLPYLRLIARHERNARQAVEQLIAHDDENSKSKRSTLRSKMNLRRQYLEDFTNNSSGWGSITNTLASFYMS